MVPVAGESVNAMKRVQSALVFGMVTLSGQVATAQQCTGGPCCVDGWLVPWGTVCNIEICRYGTCGEFGSCTGPYNQPDGTPCGDTECSVNGNTCQGGVCGGGTPVNEGNFCEDELYCSLTSHCVSGDCVPLTARNCDDGNPCTIDSCDDVLGYCVNTPGNNGSSCDDGLFCTLTSFCDSGECVAGIPKLCEDWLDCTNDSCDELFDECTHEIPDGRCLINGTCYIAFNRNPLNPCEWCLSDQSKTEWSTTPEGVSCSYAGSPECETGVCDQSGFCDPAVQELHCLIGNTCYIVFNRNPVNACQWCFPSLSQTSWSGVPDPPCITGGTECLDANDGDNCGSDRDDICTDPDTCEGPVCLRNDNPADVSCSSDNGRWHGFCSQGRCLSYIEYAEPSELATAPFVLLFGTDAWLTTGNAIGSPTDYATLHISNNSGPPVCEVTIGLDEAYGHSPNEDGILVGPMLTISPGMQDGEFQMTVMIPFEISDIGARAPSSARIVYWDGAAWTPAAEGNTVWSPGHNGPVGDFQFESGPNTPALDEFSSDIGDSGVFVETTSKRGLAWINVNHASDFAIELPVETIPAISDVGAVCLVIALVVAGVFVIQSRRRPRRRKRP